MRNRNLGSYSVKTDKPDKSAPQKKPTGGKLKHKAFCTWKPEMADELADQMLEWFDKNQDEYTNAGFLYKFHIGKHTLIRLRKISPYFAWAYEQVEYLKESRLSNKLLNKEYSTAGIIFALKNACAWRDTPADSDDTSEGFQIIDNWDNDSQPS